MSLVDAELSEPYSIFTYRYFLRNWPSLCVLAFDSTKKNGTGETPPAPPTVRGGGCRHAVATPKGACFGVVVGKMDDHRGARVREGCGERPPPVGGARSCNPRLPATKSSTPPSAVGYATGRGCAASSPAAVAAELKPLAHEVGQGARQRGGVAQHNVKGEGEGVHVAGKHGLAAHEAHSLRAGTLQGRGREAGEGQEG